MDIFNLFYIIPIFVAIGFIVVPILSIWLLIRIFSYTETDKDGRRYHRNLFYPGRICPGCGLRVLTKIPTCPSCDRDFSQNSEGNKMHHRHF